MGLLDRTKPKSQTTQSQVRLEPHELEFLLKIIADSKFDGKDVQIVYGTAVKLQKLLTE
jgi:hypothetical protein